MEQNKFDPLQFIVFLLISAILMFWFYDNQSSMIENQQISEAENLVEETYAGSNQTENSSSNNSNSTPELPTMIPFSYNKLDIESPYEDGFCSLYEDNLFGLDNACQKLSRKNCLKTRCCGLLNKTQCLAGFETGPAFSIERYKSQLQNDPAMQKLNTLIYEHKNKN